MSWRRIGQTTKGFDFARGGKRRRAAALPDAARGSRATRPRASVLECASPLALGGRQTKRADGAKSFCPPADGHDGHIAPCLVTPSRPRGKRRRAAALQDASRGSRATRPRGSVLECASPLALGERRTKRADGAKSFCPPADGHDGHIAPCLVAPSRPRGKRRRAAALQDASRGSRATRPRSSVLECASPLALGGRLPTGRT